MKLIPDVDYSDKAEVERLFQKNTKSELSDKAELKGSDISSVLMSLNNAITLNEAAMDSANDGRSFIPSNQIKVSEYRFNIGQLPPNRYNDYTGDKGKSRHKTLDATLAIILRIYDRYPALFPEIASVDIEKLYDKSRYGSFRKLSILLGKDQVSVSRYIGKGSGSERTDAKQPSSVTRLAMWLMEVFIDAGKLDLYEEIVLEEARSRGINQLHSTGWAGSDSGDMKLIKKVRNFIDKELKGAITQELRKEYEDTQAIAKVYFVNIDEIENATELQTELEIRVKGGISTPAIENDLEEATNKITKLTKQQKSVIRQLTKFASKYID